MGDMFHHCCLAGAGREILCLFSRGPGCRAVGTITALPRLELGRKNLAHGGISLDLSDTGACLCAFVAARRMAGSSSFYPQSCMNIRYWKLARAVDCPAPALSGAGACVSTVYWLQLPLPLCSALCCNLWISGSCRYREKFRYRTYGCRNSLCRPSWSWLCCPGSLSSPLAERCHNLLLPGSALGGFHHPIGVDCPPEERV
jgi:hypothetical protein